MAEVINPRSDTIRGVGVANRPNAIGRNVLLRLFGRDREEAQTPTATGGLPPPYDNVQTPPTPRHTGTGHRHHAGMSLTITLAVHSLLDQGAETGVAGGYVPR